MFYDVEEERVEVLAVIDKAQAAAWLEEEGEGTEEGRGGRDEGRFLTISAHGGEGGCRDHPARPAGVLIGLGSEEDWFEYRLARDPSFLAHVADARAALRRGEGVPLEDLDGGAA